MHRSDTFLKCWLEAEATELEALQPVRLVSERVWTGVLYYLPKMRKITDPKISRNVFLFFLLEQDG